MSAEEEAALQAAFAQHAMSARSASLLVCSCGRWSHHCERTDCRDGHAAYRNHLATVAASTGHAFWGTDPSGYCGCDGCGA